jgi:hypothetical protein
VRTPASRQRIGKEPAERKAQVDVSRQRDSAEQHPSGIVARSD